MTNIPATQERADAPASAPTEQPTFWDNLRNLWGNFRDAAWRTGAPTSDRAQTQTIFGNFLYHIHATRIHLRSLQFTATLGLGVAALASFLVATVTGIMLMIYYVPSTELAYDSVKDIHYTVPTGRFIRNLHRWSAHVMVLTVILHAVRVFLTASYKKPREFNWVIGLGLLVVTLGLSFTGYLLPWDQLAFWAATIGANIASSPRELTDAIGITAWVDPGGLSKQLMLGADEVGQPALTRFYLLHVMILPIALLYLMGLHFWRIRKDGGLARPSDEELLASGHLTATPSNGQAPGAFPRGPGKTYGLMAVVRGRTPVVGRGPENTVPSYPRAFRAEMAVVMIVVATCLVLAFFWDAPLKEKANPLVPENPAKAPWYFLGIQELVSYSAFTGGVFLPGLVIFGLALIPFLDRDKEASGVWFSGPAGRAVFLRTAVFAAFVVVAMEIFVIRFGWLRAWYPSISQLWVILINPGTVMALAFVAWSQWVLRKSGSTRQSAIALFTCIMVAFVILTYVATVHRGPNWNFYWSESQWPVH
ncbi:MAG: cytochrome b N-terminal domain-containing protein [Gemmataceae bacterium]